MTRPSRFPLALDGSERPVFLAIARALADDIRRGRLGPGASLPGTRTLARELSVHRNTVLAAYQELTAEGWIQSAPARGSFVSLLLPEVRPRGFSDRLERRTTVPAQTPFPLVRAPPVEDFAERPAGVRAVSAGVPDMRFAPTGALARAYRRALRSRSVLGYGDPRGDRRLRAALAGLLAQTRGLAAGADDVLVTRGSQMGLALLARAVLAPGEVIAVESLGYPPAWEAFRQSGAQLVPLPVDRQGLDVQALGALARRRRVRAVYLTPHHQYPTTVTLSPGRRLALLELARRERLLLIEDDYDHEFHYEGRPVLPLASVDRVGVVAYVGTLSKLLAPGLRIGYVVAPRPLLENMVAQRFFLDRQGDHAVERAVAELLEEGELERLARRMRRIYHQRRDVAVELLRQRLPQVDFDVPSGGMALWLSCPGVDLEAWQRRALREGVAFWTGRRWRFDQRPSTCWRFCFAAFDAHELEEVILKLEKSLPTERTRRRSWGGSAPRRRTAPSSETP